MYNIIARLLAILLFATVIVAYLIHKATSQDVTDVTVICTFMYLIHCPILTKETT